MLLIITGVIFIAAAVFSLWEALKSPSNAGNFLIIIPLAEGMRNAEIILREAAAASGEGKLLILDMGAGAEVLEICGKILNGRDNWEFIPKESISDPAILCKAILNGCRV